MFFKNTLPLLRLLEGRKVIFLIPLPRYISVGCCEEDDHAPNRGDPGFEAHIRSGLAEVRGHHRLLSRRLTACGRARSGQAATSPRRPKNLVQRCRGQGGSIRREPRCDARMLRCLQREAVVPTPRVRAWSVQGSRRRQQGRQILLSCSPYSRI
jgi:hypothetical protein